MDNQNPEENENLNLEGQPETEENENLENEEGSGAGDRELGEQEKPEFFNWPDLDIQTKGFKMPENGDPKSFHIILQQGGFDSETGKPLHKAYPSVHNPMDFKMLLGNAKGLGYKKIIIKHIPDGYADFQTKWRIKPTGKGTASF